MFPLDINHSSITRPPIYWPLQWSVTSACTAGSSEPRDLHNSKVRVGHRRNYTVIDNCLAHKEGMWLASKDVANRNTTTEALFNCF